MNNAFAFVKSIGKIDLNTTFVSGIVKCEAAYTRSFCKPTLWVPLYITTMHIHFVPAT